MIHTSVSLPKAKGTKKDKKPAVKSIDDILDELSDDEDEESSHQRRTPASMNSPVAKFMRDIAKQKNVKAKSVGMTYEDVVQVMDIDAYWHDLESIVEEQKDFFVHHITLRSASSIDELLVEFEGDKFPLKEIADISKKDPKRIVIDSSSIPQATKAIMEALQSQKTLNLNPQQENTRIYVPIPKVTKETRQNLAKSAKATMNETLDKLRKANSKKQSQVDEANMTGAIKVGIDQVKGVHEVLRAIEEHFAKLAREMADQKQKDLLSK